MSIEIDLTFVWVVEIGMLSVWGSILHKRTKRDSDFKSQSALTEQLSVLSVTNERRGSNPTEIVFPLFIKFISTQKPGPKRNPTNNPSTS